MHIIQNKNVYTFTVSCLFDKYISQTLNVYRTAQVKFKYGDVSPFYNTILSDKGNDNMLF